MEGAAIPSEGTKLTAAELQAVTIPVPGSGGNPGGGTDWFAFATLEFGNATESESSAARLLENGGNIKRIAECIDLRLCNLYKMLYGLK